MNGLAMGQPVAPTLANIFLCFNEEKCLKEQFKPILYKRYIDDTFFIISRDQTYRIFVIYLNTRHNCIKFTKEIENNNILNFLDRN